MTLDRHKQVLADVEHLASYYTKIDFPNIAAKFNAAADTIRELISAIEKVEQVEERKDDTQL